MPTPAAPWSRLFNDIKLAVPGAVDAVIQQELWRAVEDFLEQTNVWIEEIPVPVVPNQLSYTVTPAGKGSPHRLMVLYDPANMSPDKRWVQPGVAFIMPNQIKLSRAPSTATTWMAVMAKNINDPPTAENYPDLDDSAKWLIDHYRDAFMYCTLSYLFIQPAKAYSNPKLSGVNWQNYVYQRGKARAEINHNNVYGGQRWMFPQAYATTARKGWT